MIFVSCGTHEAPFQRLVDAAGMLARAGEEVVLQYGGSTNPPAGVDALEYVAYDRMLELMTDARAVVCHAGVGSFLTALTCGKTPIVMPRRRVHGEHVDDHQLELAERLARRGLVIVADGPADVLEAVASHAGEESTATRLAPGAELVREISGYLEERLGPPGSVAAG